MLRITRHAVRVALLASMTLGVGLANAQMMPGGGGMPGGVGRPTDPGPMTAPDDDSSHTSDVKPDVAAKKALTGALKSMQKAKAYEAEAAATTDPDKRGRLLEKLSDTYNKALDQFTEALSNKSDLVEAWSNVGYIHLQLRAYRESVDDYDHALALKPDMLDAEAYRAEACLALDRLDDAKRAYMDLFNHAPPLADSLMAAMQQWLKAHRTDAAGMRPQDIDAFDKWLSERDSIAKQTASLPHAGASPP